MSIIDKITSPIKKWLIGKALKKLIKRGALIVVAWLANHGAAQYGFTGGEAEITALIYLGLDQVKSFIKVKFPKVGDWL